MKIIQNSNGIVLGGNTQKILIKLRMERFKADSILFELPQYNGQEDDLDGIWNDKEGYLDYCINTLDSALAMLPNGNAAICFNDKYSDFILSFDDFPDKIGITEKTFCGRYLNHNILIYSTNKSEKITYPSNLEFNALLDGFDRFKVFYNIFVACCPENGIILDLCAKDNTARDTAKYLNRNYLGIEENIWNLKQIEKAG